MPPRRLFLLVFLLFLSSPLRAAPPSINPDMDRQIRKGIDAIYHMKFDLAQAEFERLRQIDPEHPYAYFGLTAVAWVRYVYETEQTDQSLIAPFEESVEKAVTVAAAWTKSHPEDAQGWMALGAVHGIMSRLCLLRGQYVKGYFTGRTAMKSVRKALKLDPELHDARLGLGMYDYYTDLYPRLVGALAKIVLRGNRARGIQTLREVSQKGRYMSAAAKMILVEIYTSDPFGARDPKAALAIMEEVRAVYPHSAMMHAAYLTSMYEAKRFDDVLRGCEEYLKQVSLGTYRPIELAKGEVIRGTALCRLNKHEEALRAFKGASSVKVGDQLSRWAVWALIRAGQAADILNRRQEALENYRQAAAQPDLWGYRKIANRYISKAYRGETSSLTVYPSP